MAAVLTATLSAPARSNTSTSATARTPPPTVSGMNTCSAVWRTTSSMVARPEDDAVTSRKVSSSAPSASYAAASSTGSPASRRFSKLTPLTTRPSSTSRQGMTRTARLVLVDDSVVIGPPYGVQHVEQLAMHAGRGGQRGPRVGGPSLTGQVGDDTARGAYQ